MQERRIRHWRAWALALPALAACGADEPASAPDESAAAAAAAQTERAAPEAPAGPPGAQWELVDAMREAAAREPHPADGGGRAWRLPDPDAVVQVGRPGRFEFVYEVGPLGIATGGGVFLQVSPFWGWSTPQVEAPEAPGYTTVEPSSAEADAEAIDLEIGTLDQQLLGILVTGRPLVAGDQLHIVYGAGSAAASVDRFAERGSRFWFGVDGDGDGDRRFLVDSPTVDVAAGPPAQVVVVAPTTVRPGERFLVRISVLDAGGSAGTDFTGTIAFEGLPESLELPSTLALAADDRGIATVEGVAMAPGIHRLRVRAGDELVATSNPMVVSEVGPRVLWGDLHGHSKLSDGTGTPEDYFRYAREVAGLDVVALSDHDHWGILPLAEHPDLWREIRDAAFRAHEPGRFVSLLAYEWTSWIHGHRHVLYFGDDAEVYDSLSTEYESPQQLWAALADQPALTLAHHSAGGPVPTNWDIPPDPVLEPLTEIVSVHGSSEAPDSPHPIYNPVPGNFVRDQLDRGYRLGFVGSGDSHDGHPGLAHLAAPSGGLAAILSEDRSRESVLKAFRERRVYATNGPRILLRTAFGSYGMGMTAPVPKAGADEPRDHLFVYVVAEAPLERIDVIRRGGDVRSIPAEGKLELGVQVQLDEIRSGDFVYVRAIQEDLGAAWSSPIFFE